MMHSDTPEPLWREVVGDTEPWRRGRLFLVIMAILQLLAQGLGLFGEIFLGNIERFFLMTLGATVSWLLFYFIWIGVHWVRWLSGGIGALLGFSKLIWGVRDGNAGYLIDGTIGFAVSAYLGLAPSIYFFAQRQKERVRWKESLIVAAVFAVLLASFGAAILALFGYKTHLEARGRAFADKTFQRVFIQGDIEFLKHNITVRLMEKEGWDRLSWFMADCYMRIGVAENLQPAEGRLQFRFQFPASVISVGRMSAAAKGRDGPVRFFVVIGGGDGGWQIDSLSWNYDNPPAGRSR